MDDSVPFALEGWLWLLVVLGGPILLGALLVLGRLSWRRSTTTSDATTTQREADAATRRLYQDRDPPAQ